MLNLNNQIRLAKDDDIFLIYDALKEKRLKCVLNSSQLSSNISLNRIRNYLFSYDVIFSIHVNEQNIIDEMAAFEIPQQMFLEKTPKLFYWGYATDKVRLEFIKESFNLLKHLLNTSYVSLIINRAFGEENLLNGNKPFSDLNLFFTSEIKSIDTITDTYYINID